MKSTTAFAAVTMVSAFAAAMLTPWAAHAKMSRAGESSVSFAATGPVGMKITGTTTDLNVIDDASNLTVSVPLGNLKTGIALRDQHMREKYLQVGKYPTADLVVARGALKIPAAGGETNADAQGTMKIHGQARPVTFHYTAKRDGARFLVSGTVHLDIKQFGIDVPSYLGVTVNQNIDVAVKFAANDA